MGFNSSIFFISLILNLIDDIEKQGDSPPLLCQAIAEFKLQLQSGNTKFGSNSAIYL